MRARSVSRSVYKQDEYLRHGCALGYNTHVCVNAANRDGEHSIKVRCRRSNEGNQVTEGEYACKKSGLDCATDESIENSVRLAEAGLGAREDGPQCDCKTRLATTNIAKTR